MYMTHVNILTPPCIRADAERAFSMLRKIQQDLQGSLNNSTILSLMSAKMNSNDICITFKPSNELQRAAESITTGTTNVLPTSSTSISASSKNPFRSLNHSGLAPWEIHQRGDASSVGEDCLYTNDNGSDGVMMLVDTSEWGGDRVGLGQLCELLSQTGMRYKTKRLPTGDYSWLWRSNGKERILPLLVERKRADDVARTLKDGRFWSQVNKMVAWKKEFIETGVQCQLQYLLESQPEQYVVRCADRCKGVGHCGNPTLIQVKCAINDLKLHPELDVQETTGIEDTVIYLASLTADLINRVQKGDFDIKLVRELVQAECFVIANASSNVVEVLDDSGDDDNEDIKNQNDADDTRNSYQCDKQQGFKRNPFTRISYLDVPKSENKSDTELKQAVMLSLLEQNKFGKVDSVNSVKRYSAFRKEFEWKRTDHNEDFIGKKDNASALDDPDSEGDITPVSEGEVTPIQPLAQYATVTKSVDKLFQNPRIVNSISQNSGVVVNQRIKVNCPKNEDKGQKSGFGNLSETRYSISLNSWKRSMNENEEIKEKNTANISDNLKKICTSLMKKKCSNYEKKEDNFYLLLSIYRQHKEGFAS